MWPLVHAPDERIDVRDLGAAARCYREICWSCSDERGNDGDRSGATRGADDARATLRLGGMALRNGLLVHGPTAWAAAIRTATGTIARRLGAQAARCRRRGPESRARAGSCGSARRCS